MLHSGMLAAVGLTCLAFLAPYLCALAILPEARRRTLGTAGLGLVLGAAAFCGTASFLHGFIPFGALFFLLSVAGACAIVVLYLRKWEPAFALDETISKSRRRLLALLILAA